MSHPHIRAICAGALLAVLLVDAAAIAQPAPAAAPAGEADTARKADAKGHFDKALRLFDEEAWDGALVEFLRSRELHPTRAAAKNAGICLHKLKRFDEALDMFEELLSLPGLSAEDKALATDEVKTLRDFVGVLDIVSEEPGATIVIDGRNRGLTPAAAPLRVSVGTHLVRVSKPSFEAFEARVNVAGGQSIRVPAKLSPLAGAALPPAGTPVTPAPKPTGPRGNIFLGADAAFAVATSFGGELATACEAPCSSSPALGFSVLGRGGYRFASGFQLGLDAGYLHLSSTTTGRATTLEPTGLPKNVGAVDDALTLRGLVVGAAAGLEIGKSFPLTLQLGAGALIGSMKDHREGTLATVDRPGRPGASYKVDASETQAMVAAYVAPEARFGVRFGTHVHLSAGLRVLMIIAASPPAWVAAEKQVRAGSDGQATFPTEDLTGPVVLTLEPGLAATFSF